MQAASKEPAIFSTALTIKMALAQSPTASVSEFMRVALMELTRSLSAQALANADVGNWIVATELAWHDPQHPAPRTCSCNRVRAGSNLVVRTLSRRLRGRQTLSAKTSG